MKYSRTVVFWYDEQSVYTVEALTEALVDQPIHVRELTRNNFFSLKIEIEVEKKNESFLLYAHFQRYAQFEDTTLQQKYETTRANVSALFVDDWLQLKGCHVLEQYIRDIEEQLQIISK